MIILHAGALGEQLFLWAEQSDGAETKSTARRGPRSRNHERRPLPLYAGFEAISAALETAGIEVDVKQAPRRQLALWLPTRAGLPLPSDPLIAPLPDSRAKPVIHPWLVSALGLSATAAMELLCSATGKSVLGPGVIVGRDLAFWTAALQLAGALVAQEQFLPALVRESGAWRATWEPVLAGDHGRRLAALAKRMPAVARALSDEAAQAPPKVPAASLLTRFVGRMVDRLVRPGAPSGPPVARAPARRRAKAPAFDSLHDQWLHALQAADGLMEGDSRELARLAEQIEQWRRPIAVTAAAPLRLCFRLEEPDEKPESDAAPPHGDGQPKRRRPSVPPDNGSAWCVRYLLQAVDDPSLLIPAEDAWPARGKKRQLPKFHDFPVQEYLLSALGQASGVCPPVEASLKAARPAGYATDAAGAHQFLTEGAMALEQAGFGVLLPAWWTRKGTKLRLSVRASVKSPAMQGAGQLSLEELVAFDWEVAIGDQTLSMEELEALARLKQPLVQVRGQWVQMTAGEIQAALDFWKQRSAGTATVRQIVEMALGARQANEGIAFEGVRATGWVGDLLARLEGEAAFEELTAPKEFSGILRPYQTRGYSWLSFLRQWGLGAGLADDMGLGKTIQTLALIQRDWHADGQRPVLLICPTSVVGNWQKEAARFTPELPVMVHHGITRAKHGAFTKAAAQHAMVVSSYALLHRDLEYLREVPWAGVILDEAQNIKNPETKQARAARSLKADYRLALSGTPVENHVGDLWSIMEFLNPGLLGSRAEFKRSYFIPIQASRDPDAAARLRQVTGPFILRRLKTDKTVIADLPEKQEMKVFCTLTKEQASLYTAVLKEAERALDDSEGIQRKGLILGMLSKLKQVCNHPAHFLGDNSSIPGRSGKLARLTEMLEELLEVGDRALLFSQFTEMGEILRRHLEETFGRAVLFLHGGVPKRQRDVMVERFQATDGPPIFLLSLKAGGTGLNLTRANHVFHFDRWWNPAVENQATDRAFRIGQTRNVQVHKFICVGTFEERIDALIESKRQIAEQVIGAGEGWLTELSNRQLKQVFALGREAVEA